MNRRFYIFALVALFWTSRAEAVTWYVNDATGTDVVTCSTASNPASTPKKTIRAGIQCAKDNGAPGNTVEIAAGNYNERLEAGFIPSGTVGNPFTITNKAGDTITWKPLSTAGLFNPIVSLEATGVQYVNLIGKSGFGFKIDGTFQTGGGNSITIGGSGHNIIQGVEFTNTNGTNSIFVGSTNNLIIGNKIHDGTHVDPVTPGVGYPIYVEGSSNTIDGNEMYSFPRYGIHVNFSGGSVSNTIVRNNIIHGGVTALSNSEAAIVCATNCTTGNQFYSNLIYGMLQGHGIVVSGNGTAVYNNTIYQSPQKGIYVYPINSNNISVKNNISYQNGTGDTLDEGSGTTWSNNWCGSISAPTCQFGGNPLFTNPAAGNFTLQATSLAINAGTPNISPLINIPACAGSVTTNCYNGTAPDLGAFETGVPTAGGGPPTLTPNLINVAPGGTILLSVSEDTVNQRTELTGDSVNVLPTGAANYDQSPIDYLYMNSTKIAPTTPISNAVLTFTAPLTVGTYDFVFYPDGATQASQYLAVATFNVVLPGIVMKFVISTIKIGPSVTWKIGTP